MSAEQEQQQHPAIQDLLKGNGPVDRGYYSALGLGFTASAADVQKQYKRLALQNHPDKAGDDPEATTRFQSIQTAYQVLSNRNATKAYWDMFRLRCYMYQLPHQPERHLQPFYLMHVRKKDELGHLQERMLTLDVREGVMQNWKKDKGHRRIPLSALKAVKSTGDNTFTIAFTRESSIREYRLSVESPPHCALYVSVLQGIIDHAKTWTDDAIFPPRCERKGYVEKKGKTGDWSRRWLMLGTCYILIFRTTNCEELVNSVMIHPTNSSVALLGNDGAWCVTTPGRRWTFRNSKLQIAKDWVAAVGKMLSQTSTDWLSGSHGLKRSLCYSQQDIDELLASNHLLVDTPLEEITETAEHSDAEDDDAAVADSDPEDGGGCALDDDERHPVQLGADKKRSSPPPEKKKGFLSGLLRTGRKSDASSSQLAGSSGAVAASRENSAEPGRAEPGRPARAASPVHFRSTSPVHARKGSAQSDKTLLASCAGGEVPRPRKAESSLDAHAGRDDVASHLIEGLVRHHV